MKSYQGAYRGATCTVQAKTAFGAQVRAAAEFGLAGRWQHLVTVTLLGATT